MGSCHSTLTTSAYPRHPHPSIPHRYRHLIQSNLFPCPSHTFHTSLGAHRTSLTANLHTSTWQRRPVFLVVQPGVSAHPPTIYALCEALEGRNPYVLVGTGLPRDKVDLQAVRVGWKSLMCAMSDNGWAGGLENVTVLLVGGDSGRHEGFTRRDGRTFGVGVRDIIDVLMTEQHATESRCIESVFSTGDLTCVTPTPHSSSSSLTLVDTSGAQDLKTQHEKLQTAYDDCGDLDIVLISPRGPHPRPNLQYPIAFSLKHIQDSFAFFFALIRALRREASDEVLTGQGMRRIIESVE